METKKLKEKLYEIETQNCREEDETDLTESSLKVLINIFCTFICMYICPYFGFLELVVVGCLPYDFLQKRKRMQSVNKKETVSKRQSLKSKAKQVRIPFFLAFVLFLLVDPYPP